MIYDSSLCKSRKEIFSFLYFFWQFKTNIKYLLCYEIYYIRDRKKSLFILLYVLIRNIFLSCSVYSNNKNAYFHILFNVLHKIFRLLDKLYFVYIKALHYYLHSVFLTWQRFQKNALRIYRINDFIF